MTEPAQVRLPMPGWWTPQIEREWLGRQQNPGNPVPDDPLVLFDWLISLEKYTPGSHAAPRRPLSSRKLQLLEFNLKLYWATRHPAGGLFNDAPRRLRWLEDHASRDLYITKAYDAARRAIVDYTKAGIRPRSIATPSAVAHNRNRMDKGQACHLIRDLFGNPACSVRWSACDRCFGSGWRTQYDHDSDSRLYAPCQVCGPDPRSVVLARGAYDEPLPEACKECDGFGGEDKYPADDPTNTRLEGSRWYECAPCDGKGVLGTYHLDNDRLAVLADSLQDAGYPDVVRCPGCGGRGDGYPDAPRCHRCNGIGKVVNPVLAHLRLPCLHYRGCWALDCVLGKE